ncbi:MAG: NERD domain-containing protein [Chloroflexi bacterium]|nr:NERD domain-containing protein [Chloroflexota bacterium]
MLWSTFKASVKGIWGEKLVEVGAALTLPSSDYRKYHNVTLQTPRGTTQIDHVFVSAFGVFVVETKNMVGWIYGSERDREWMQVFRSGKKYKFLNPLRQNYGHVRALEEALASNGLPRGVVRSVVVFVGNAQLKRELPENVTVGLGGSRYIRSFRHRALSVAQVAMICELIESRRMEPSWRTSRRHIRSLENESPSATRWCPRCGQKMVLRTARRGQFAGKRFWGCEGFPACRMVEKE